MMATCRGSLSAGILIGESVMKIRTEYMASRPHLHFHDLRFLVFSELGDLFDESIGQFLQIFLTGFQIVLRDQLLLFEIAHIIMRITANVSNCNARLL